MDRKILAVLTAIFTLTLGLVSCSSGSTSFDGPGDGMVTLVLDLSVNTGTPGVAPAQEGVAASQPSHHNAASQPSHQESASRASDGVGFEPPVDAYEKIKQLRIIITRPASSNTVEHNTLTTYDDVVESLTSKEFKVMGAEMKAIYFIANEDYLPADVRTKLRNIQEGQPLNVDLPNLTIDNPNLRRPYISNSSGDKSYIPMTEFFDVKIPDASTLEDGMTVEDENGVKVTKKYLNIRNLFVTRTTTKFSFRAVRADNSVISQGMKITKITFSGTEDNTGLGTKEYLFPNHAVYSPSKYTPSNEDLGGREILSFNVPPTAASYSYTFFPENFGLNRIEASADGYTDLQNTYVPLDYFLESGLNKFTVSITTVNQGVEKTWPPATLPNLPRLPRNTHVVIEFRLSDTTLTAVVKLVPWIGVTLDYTFGFDSLIPWTRPNNNQVLPV